MMLFFQMCNGTTIKALRKGINIKMAALIAVDEIEIKSSHTGNLLIKYYIKIEV